LGCRKISGGNAKDKEVPEGPLARLGRLIYNRAPRLRPADKNLSEVEAVLEVGNPSTNKIRGRSPGDLLFTFGNVAGRPAAEFLRLCWHIQEQGEHKRKKAVFEHQAGAPRPQF
jgi:hypothetical protein